MLRQNVEVTQDKKGVNPAVHVVQGDSGRTIVALVKDATISGTATLSFERPDGTSYSTSATINSDNSVEATLTTDMLRVAGTGKATFRIVSSGSQVSTFAIYVLVEPSAGFERSPSTASNKIYVYINGSAVEVAKQSDLTTTNSNVATNTSDISGLKTRVTSAENKITLINENMREMGEDIGELYNTKASTSDITTVNSKISLINENIREIGEDISELYSIKANATDVTALTTRVTNVETDNSAIKSDLTNLTKVEVIWESGKRLTVNGIEIDTPDWYITNYIGLRDDILFQLSFTIKNANGYHAYCTYDKNKIFLSVHEVDNTSIDIVKGITNITDTRVKYIRFCSFNSDGVHNISISDIGNLKLKNGFVTTDVITDRNVTLEKCSFVGHDTKSNYIDRTKITDGYYIQQNGIPKPQSDYAITDYIEVESGVTYYGYHLTNGYCAFYDENQDYVIGYNYGSFPFPITIPNGCKYARFSINTGWWADYKNDVWLYTENKRPKDYMLGLTVSTIDINTNPCEYDGNEICVFRKGLCIGDSLTEGVFNYTESGTTQYLTDKTKSYPSKLAILTGLEITNKGHGGLTSAEWYTAEQNTDLSGFDFCIIQLGVNDSVRYSGWTQTSIDAFTNIINKIKSENNKIKIYVATIIPAVSYSGTNIDAVSQGIRTFVTNLADDNVILLDMALYGHTKDSNAYNCGHLSELGYYQLAKDYKSYISYDIANNLMKYQQVQFIGTNHSYS